VSDIDTAVVDSLKALDPKRPIREADIVRLNGIIAYRSRKNVVSSPQSRHDAGASSRWNIYPKSGRAADHDNIRFFTDFETFARWHQS
jgi:hypothetical protein